MGRVFDMKSQIFPSNLRVDEGSVEEIQWEFTGHRETAPKVSYRSTTKIRGLMFKKTSVEVLSSCLLAFIHK